MRVHRLPASAAHELHAAENRRGSTGLFVVAGVAAAALIAFLAIDFEALERGRLHDGLVDRVAAYQAARTAEDAAALGTLIVPLARDGFDAEHMQLRWAFDRSEVLSVGEPELDIRWDTRRAVVTQEVTVEVELEPEATQAHPFDLTGPEAAPAATSEEQRHTLEQTWLLTDGDWYLSPGDEPWGRSRVEALHGERIEALEARFERFVEVRLVDDQQALYSMYTEGDREGTSLGQYLSIYGQGVMKVHDIDLLDLEVDDAGSLGRVRYELDSEMVLKNLPPDMRARLAGTPREELRRQVQIEQVWEFADGEWWLHMEEDPSKDRTTNKVGG